MVSMTASAWQNGPASEAASPQKSDIGEIDTNAPFQSVKAAVSLFRGVGSPKTSPVSKKSNAEERVLEKETQHQMITRELGYYKDQLRIAQMGKSQALHDLQRANRTFQELTNKLENLSVSRQASIGAAQDAKIKLKELQEQQLVRADAWKLDLESQRGLYKTCAAECIASREVLANLRRNFEAAMEEKQVLFRKAEEVQIAGQANQERQSQLLEEVAALREKLDQAKMADIHAQEEHEKAMAEKEACFLARRSAKEEAEKRIKSLEGEFEGEETLKEKLQETYGASKVLQKQLNEMRASDLRSLESFILDLQTSNKSLQEVVEEENLIRTSVLAMEDQLAALKRQRLDANNAVVEAESAVEKMQVELDMIKNELQTAMEPSLQKLSAETKEAKTDAEHNRKKANLLIQEAEAARMAAKQAEENLNVALAEAESAKKRADNASFKCSASKKITLSVEAFNSLKNRIQEFKNQADVKVSAILAEAEAIKAKKKGATEKAEMIMKENEAMKAEIEDALKRAEMAATAKSVVENELQKWRRNKQNESTSKPIQVKGN